MSICTFFGHRDCPETIRPALETVLRQLIEQHAVHHFLIGHQGSFDRIVCQTLLMLIQDYPALEPVIVLSSLQQNALTFPVKEIATTFPEGIEHVPPRYAIAFRNEWMLRQADFVVSYIVHPWGHACHYIEKAERLGKTVFRLS